MTTRTQTEEKPLKRSRPGIVAMTFQIGPCNTQQITTQNQNAEQYHTNELGSNALTAKQQPALMTRRQQVKIANQNKRRPPATRITTNKQTHSRLGPATHTELRHDSTQKGHSGDT